MAGNFIHAEEYLHSGDIVELDCDTQCNFMLLDGIAFSHYKRGERFQYYGGHFSRFPARIAAPSSGSWHVVIDLGGASANVRYGLRVIKQD